MAGELVYTSVLKGLNKGESGFCVVARSADISPMLQNRLEALSGYREIISAIDLRAHENPVNFANTVVDCGHERFNVISRIGFAGLDYSGRSNKIADHLILTSDEIKNAGPAELLGITDLFYHKWNKPPILLTKNAKLIPQKPVIADTADYWQAVTGDSGWAEHLIELSRRNTNRPIYIITQLGVDNLTLVKEALRLLPINEQWQYTFSTYCSSNIRDINYRWRFIYPGTDIYSKIKNSSHAVNFDLSNLPAEILSASINSASNSAPRQPLRLSATMATIVPDRYRFEPSDSQTSGQSCKTTKQRPIGMIIAIVVALLLIGLLCYLFFGRKNIANVPEEADDLTPSTLVPEVASESPPQSTKKTTTVKKNISIEPPSLIVFNRNGRAHVKLKVPLQTLINKAVLNKLYPLSVKLEFVIKSEFVKKLCIKHGIEFNNQFVSERSSFLLNTTETLKSTINELANKMAVDPFIKHLGCTISSGLVDKIKLQLAKPSGNNKNFYENSAEYLLGELYPKFKRQYIAFDIQRGKIINQKRKLLNIINKTKKVIKKILFELEDTGMEISKREQFTDELLMANKKLKALRKQRSQLIIRLKTQELPQELKIYRDALLRTFFCFGKNYMAEAEEIIGFKRNSPAIKYIRTEIKKTKIAQQLSYENEFKMDLNGYVYRRTIEKIISNGQSQLEKQRMTVEYNRQHKLFKLIIEDDDNGQP